MLGSAKVIACKVFKDELEHLGIREEECSFLDQELHRSPPELNKKLKETLGKIEEECSPREIILIYGYCGGALEDISANRASLTLARVTD